jgi:hypothetical protein
VTHWMSISFQHWMLKRPVVEIEPKNFSWIGA